MPIEGKCSQLQEGIVNLMDFDFCQVATITTKYNLTLLSTDERILGLNSLGHALMEAAYTTHVDYIVYRTSLRIINFVTIANPPSPSS